MKLNKHHTVYLSSGWVLDLGFDCDCVADLLEALRDDTGREDTGAYSYKIN